MRRIAVVTVFAVATAATSTGTEQKMEGHRHRVIIKNLQFVPADVVVAPGDTVVWVNQDFVQHTVTSRDETWDSHALAQNATWEMHVTESTSGEYVCRYHPMMHGRLVIARK